MSSEFQVYMMMLIVVLDGCTSHSVVLRVQKLRVIAERLVMRYVLIQSFAYHKQIKEEHKLHVKNIRVEILDSNLEIDCWQ